MALGTHLTWYVETYILLMLYIIPWIPIIIRGSFGNGWNKWLLVVSSSTLVAELFQRFSVYAAGGAKTLSRDPGRRSPSFWTKVRRFPSSRGRQSRKGLLSQKNDHNDNTTGKERSQKKGLRTRKSASAEREGTVQKWLYSLELTLAAVAMWLGRKLGATRGGARHPETHTKAFEFGTGADRHGEAQATPSRTRRERAERTKLLYTRAAIATWLGLELRATRKGASHSEAHPYSERHGEAGTSGPWQGP